MKKLALIFLLLPFCCFAQNRLLLPGEKDIPSVNGMLGISFGKTKAECVALMKSKGYSYVPKKSDYLTFNNIKFAGRTNASASFYFHKNKFYHGLVIITPSQMPKALDEYNNVVGTLEEKYGPSDPIREYKYPYEDGDGHEMTALKGGYATITDLWKGVDPGIIFTKITESALICVEYIHRATAQEVLNEEKQKDLSEL